MSHTINLPATFDFAFRPALATPAWVNAFVNVASKAYAIAAASQDVIVMRLTALAVNGNTANNRKEVQRMFTEKMSAVNEASAVLMKYSATVAKAVPTTFFDPKAAEEMLNQAAQASDEALGSFESRVTANQKRLGA